MGANPNPARITEASWWFMEQLLALEPGTENGGTFADKPAVRGRGGASSARRSAGRSRWVQPSLLAGVQTDIKRCSRCKAVKPHSDFYSSSGRTRDGLHAWCGPCTRTYNRDYIKRNSERNRARARKSRVRYKYGITWQERDALIHAQGNCCAICRETFADSKRTHIDHDHKTGRVRGILCFRCNSGLGSFKDDVDRLFAAAAYLFAEVSDVQVV